MSIFEAKITPSVNTDTGEITMLVEALGQRISKEVMYTKDEASRAALIALGWTPPDNHLREIPNDMGFGSIYEDGPVGMALSWLESALECESFLWDWDQHECAKHSLESAKQWMKLLGPVPKVKHEEA